MVACAAKRSAWFRSKRINIRPKKNSHLLRIQWAAKKINLYILAIVRNAALIVHLTAIIGWRWLCTIMISILTLFCNRMCCSIPLALVFFLIWWRQTVDSIILTMKHYSNAETKKKYCMNVCECIGKTIGFVKRTNIRIENEQKHNAHNPQIMYNSQIVWLRRSCYFSVDYFFGRIL